MSRSVATDISLHDDIQFLPGVGPSKAEHLRKLGVRTIGDLIEYFPVRHDRQEARTIENLDEGMIATVVGQVSAIRPKYGARGRSVSATLVDNTGRCSLYWFNAGWVMERLEPGMNIQATGRVRDYRQLPQLVNPRFVVLGEDAQPVDESQPATFEGVYPASAGISSREITKLIHKNLDRMIERVEECWDEAHLKGRDLMPRPWAIRTLHQPTGKEEDAVRARRRLAYDELLLMQLATGISRLHRNKNATAFTLRTTDEIDRRIRLRFPFTMTNAQDRAVKEVVRDLAESRPMNRLLQGDVGSGKTVVALYAALSAVANKTQVAIMAPTEILADQHRRTIDQYLAGSRVRHALLTGRLREPERRDILQRIEAGELDIVVGTHALIQEDVRFAKLSLVVIDEQHRFGVRQRATIRAKGPAPHYLVMTATPIPRTLAMTVFGDLDVTTVDELPPGRAGIQTTIVPPLRYMQAWTEVRTRLAHGEQAYVVYPLIDESDKIEARAATAEYRRLSQEIFTGYRVGLLHGRLGADEREAVMRDFVAGKIHVLVATTVIEVGIDVPRATCMVIEQAERYGLSQLHQLRGRVGRGSRPGYCFLMLGSATTLDNARLNVLESTSDGFKIAEEDLRLRGPGEMVGTRQHGVLEFRVADLLRDGELLRLAQRDVGEIIHADPMLKLPNNRILRAMLLAKYGENMPLTDVG